MSSAITPRNDTTWREVQARLQSVSAKYTKHADGSPKGRAMPGKATTYPLSGLLACGCCGSAMSIYGGSSASYIRCSQAMRRGTCNNRASVREDVARECIFGFIHDALAGREGVTDVRRRLAEQLGELHRRRHEQLVEHRDRLRRTEARVANLVTFLADGERSEAVVLALRDHEAQSKAEHAAIASLEREGAEPVRLPSPAEVLKRVADLEACVRADPTAGRELMRRLLKDGRVVLTPGEDAVYTAAGELLPASLFLETKTPSPGLSLGSAYYSGHSGGTLGALNDAISLPFGGLLVRENVDER